MKPEYDFSTGERGKFYRRGVRLNLPRHAVAPDRDHPNGDSLDHSPDPVPGVSRPPEDNRLGDRKPRTVLVRSRARRASTR